MSLVHIAHQDYRSKDFEAGTVLSADFSDCNFYLSNMSGVTFTGSFKNCKFISAELRHSNMIGAAFNNCSFVGASFKHSQIRNCEFHSCDFAGASMFGIAGISTSTFHINCKGVLGMNTDLYIKVLGSKQRYVLCPKDVTAKPVTFEPIVPAGNMREFNLNEYKPMVRREVNFAKHNVYSTHGDTAVKEDKLVDANPLPPVTHYRSPPSKILESKKTDPKAAYEFDEDDYYCNVYTMGGRGWSSFTYNEEYMYGYMKNAVLECSEIEEYTECQK